MSGQPFTGTRSSRTGGTRGDGRCVRARREPSGVSSRDDASRRTSASGDVSLDSGSLRSSELGPAAADDEILVWRMTEELRAQIQSMLETSVRERNSIWR